MRVQTPPVRSTAEAVGFSGMGDEGEPRRAAAVVRLGALGGGAIISRPCVAPGCAVLCCGGGQC